MFAKTWTESALIISPLSRLASSKARRLFPAPVGPDTTITFSFSLLLVAETEHAVLKRRRRIVKVTSAAVRRARFFDDDGRRGQNVRTQLLLIIMFWVERERAQIGLDSIVFVLRYFVRLGLGRGFGFRVCKHQRGNGLKWGCGVFLGV